MRSQRVSHSLSCSSSDDQTFLQRSLASDGTVCVTRPGTPNHPSRLSLKSFTSTADQQPASPQWHFKAQTWPEKSVFEALSGVRRVFSNWHGSRSGVCASWRFLPCAARRGSVTLSLRYAADAKECIIFTEDHTLDFTFCQDHRQTCSLLKRSSAASSQRPNSRCVRCDVCRSLPQSSLSALSSSVVKLQCF